MYNLPYFKENDESLLIDFMQQHPFALITGTNEQNEPVATQLPFLVKERNGKMYLQAHLMKQTDHHKAFVQNTNVLVVFTSPSCYVSASWYSNQKQASTWNYMAVHAKGIVSFLSEEALIEMLNEVTNHYENNSASPSLYKDIPKEYIQKIINAIVAIEVEVTALNHVFKLSQNSDEMSYNNIINHLKNGDMNQRFIATEMDKNKAKIFK